jgi:hypothetical protein
MADQYKGPYGSYSSVSGGGKMNTTMMIGIKSHLTSLKQLIPSSAVGTAELVAADFDHIAPHVGDKLRAEIDHISQVLLSQVISTTQGGTL